MIKKYFYKIRFAILITFLFGSFILLHNQLMVNYHCPFHSLTGLYCPGCGGLRAVDSLLKADFVQAFRYNSLIVILPPLLFLFLNRSFRERVAETKHKRIEIPLLILFVVLSFGIFRNVFSF